MSIISKFINNCRNNTFLIAVYKKFPWNEIVTDIKMRLSRDIFSSHKIKSIFFLPNHKSDYIQNTIFRTGLYYENESLSKVFEQAKNKKLMERIKSEAILDIGANIGNHTLFFINECNALKVYAFEPISTTFSILKKNIQINNCENRVFLYNVAVGKEISAASISHYYPNNIGGTTLKSDHGGKIKLVSIDSLAYTENIALIKIDVEGFEKDVFLGAKETIMQKKPYILAEIRHEFFQEILAIINQANYKVTILEDNPHYKDCLFSPAN